jgi:hypothetical protein
MPNEQPPVELSQSLRAHAYAYAHVLHAHRLTRVGSGSVCSLASPGYRLLAARDAHQCFDLSDEDLAPLPAVRRRYPGGGGGGALQRFYLRFPPPRPSHSYRQRR